MKLNLNKIIVREIIRMGLSMNIKKAFKNNGKPFLVKKQNTSR